MTFGRLGSGGRTDSHPADGHARADSQTDGHGQGQGHGHRGQQPYVPTQQDMDALKAAMPSDADEVGRDGDQPSRPRSASYPLMRVTIALAALHIMARRGTSRAPHGVPKLAQALTHVPGHVP